MENIFLFGYQISNNGLEGDVNAAVRYIESMSKRKYMACANPHSLVVAEKDPLFKKALQNADILLPDGTGIILSAKILGLKIEEKVAGTDFFLSLSEKLDKKGGKKVFFMGSSNQVLDAIKVRMERDYPNIDVCGTFSPPFKPVFNKADNMAIIKAINDAKPDVLWVGMTAPKQEKWIFENMEKLNVPFAAAIGAVFDFYGGTKKRSSPFWINIGLEWLPRFLKEPKRLWERNMKSTPVFLWWTVIAKVRQFQTR